MTTETNAVAADASAHSAQDIAKRVLHLIDAVRGAQDLTPANIQQQTGLPVAVSPDDPGDYGVTGKLSDVWYYGLRTMSTPPGERPNRLLFQFNDQTGSGADMSPVCVSVEDTHAALTAAGYSAARTRNRLDTQDVWEFTRGDVGVTLNVRGKRTPDDAQTCVSMLIINAYA